MTTDTANERSDSECLLRGSLIALAACIAANLLGRICVHYGLYPVHLDFPQETGAFAGNMLFTLLGFLMGLFGLLMGLLVWAAGLMLYIGLVDLGGKEL
ncbi:hypothetical protein C4K04_2711 [Pseudomonas chlororaphis]|uniref:Uncharacterized protein n=1 Tax=Pseudomonas chlororaphis TaxID=587753 RepID=A0A3G7TMR4_9PSED|nr:hypothetical protein [Pseudomonas chlororaphis]AZE48383.1 hypothetical protein C4K04_2711 [Pseudomonas chlororaphis]